MITINKTTTITNNYKITTITNNNKTTTITNKANNNSKQH